METKDTYSVIIRKKVPYLSEFLNGMIFCCLIGFVIFYFLFAPSLRSSNEMKVVATVRIIPNYAKWVFLYSGIGFIVFNYFYKKTIINVIGLLNFYPTTITITTKRIAYIIPIFEIRNIELIDPTDLDDYPKGEFFVIIHQHNLNILQFKLAEYYQAESFIDKLLSYDTLKEHIKSPERLNAPDIIDPDN